MYISRECVCGFILPSLGIWNNCKIINETNRPLPHFYSISFSYFSVAHTIVVHVHTSLHSIVLHP